MPTGEHAIAAINALTGLLPHFLALSASSPFWQGADTGIGINTLQTVGVGALLGAPTSSEGLA